ncbi:ABC transporter substrate-binding protein [Rhizobium sp. CF142]|uniref:ABC transporter substrate-binding protein n=1 Tax=Rhizobium sp. CF142 TaxID=1144314 RepID=UPI00026EE94D|nr:ABC transporter substrate-binding protein [Rhizobium sp. CF142]EJJ31483.1 ABC-type branched-chain amino acid transport system, periplasmic component [Rhizobium sp. CF142]
MKKVTAVLGLALLATIPLSATAQDVKPIRIGEVNSYSGALAAFTAGYRKGFDLAVENVNGDGGVLGRPLEVIYRDDNLSPADAVRVANELVSNQGVDLLAGTYLSPSGLAIANYADRRKVFFVATEPLSNAVTWSKGSRFVFRVQTPSLLLATALAVQAKGLQCTKWAGTGPMSEAVTDMVRDFQAELRKTHPDLVWADDSMAPVGRFNAGATIEHLQRLGVDCVFSAHVGPDMISFLRESKARGFYDKVKVVSVQAGLPEWLNSFGSEAPTGWITNGLPYDEIDTPPMRDFVAKYRAKYNEEPIYGAFLAYLSVEGIASGIKRAGSTNVEDLIKGFRGDDFDCVLGKCRWRVDHQLSLGAWVGSIAGAEGKAKMIGWRYISGDEGLPSEADGLAMRPAAANN